MFRIISDSSCDIAPEIAKELDIEIIPYYASFDGENYIKEGVDVSVEDFYNQMVEKAGIFPKTSMPAIVDFMDAFERYAQNGDEVLCICLNSKFSGSYQGALTAKEEVLNEYPDMKIEVVDSEQATLLQGMFVREACALRDKGFSLEETVERLNKIRSTGRIFFTTNDLEYLRHGGRIGSAAVALSNMLNLKPLIIYIDKQLISGGIARGHLKALGTMIEQFKAHVKENDIDLSEYRVALARGYDTEDFNAFKQKVEEEFADVADKIEQWEVYHVGVTIGVHTGPYPTGIALLKRAI